MGDEKRAPTAEEVRRDRIASPQSLAGEGGMQIGNTETGKRLIDGEPVKDDIVTHPGVAGTLGGEFMEQDDRIDGELREEDVTEEDALNDDVREAEEPVPLGAPLPGGAQGEDAEPHERIDEGGVGPRYPEGDPRNDED